MMVGLISCSKAKRKQPALARDLYRGHQSRLFSAAAAYVQRWCPVWAILSAKHGVVMPTDLIAPYDVTLEGMTKAERDAWSRRTRAQLIERWPGQTFLVVLGEDYMAALEGLPHHAPFAGLELTGRLAALKAANAEGRSR